ncbi:hypothetical protein V6N13_113945 [Hibiscus sabdariffa]
MVKDNWKSLPSLGDTISQFTAVAEVWNSSAYGCISAKKRSIMARPCGAQKALERRQSDWVASGDCHTTYFHRKTKLYRPQNRVNSMQLPDGTWCDDESSLRDAATIYFRNLYADSDATGGCYPISRCFPYDDNHLMEYLYTVPLFDEETLDLGTYLGVLILQHRLRCVNFDFVIEKL